MRQCILTAFAATLAIAASACNSERGSATRGDSATRSDSGAAAAISTSAGSPADARLRLGSPASGDLVIGPATTEQELIAAFGAENVTRETVALAEGESKVTTV